MEKLLTAPQIAEHLGVKLSTIYQWTHEGFIPHFKIKESLRFRASTVEEWLSQHERPGRKTRRVDVGELGV